MDQNRIKRLKSCPSESKCLADKWALDLNAKKQKGQKTRKNRNESNKKKISKKWKAVKTDRRPEVVA